MSGPVQTPLKVTESDGSPSGRPITEIVVSNSDLSISGVVATIDTTGASSTPATPANAVQFNSNPAGTFTGSAQLLYETGSNLGRLEMKTGTALVMAEIRAMEGWGLQLIGSDSTGGTSAPRNTIAIFGENDTPDGIYLLSNTTVQVSSGGLTTDTVSTDLVLSTYLDEDKAKITLEAGAGGGVVVQTDDAGVMQLENTTTDADSVLSIMGNGTGDAKLDLQNASKRVWVLCDENKKLKIQGGSGGNTFIFDVSSATGGLEFPDGTTQTTAASGGGGGISSVLPLLGSTGATEYNVATAMPWGNSSTATQTVIAFGGQAHAFPFIAPETGTVDEIGVRVTTGDAGMSLYVAIYSNDSNNLPNTLLGYATIPLDATGNIYDSSLSANPSLTAGTAYWYTIHGNQAMYNAVLQSNTITYLPDLGITDGLSDQTYSIEDGAMTQYAVPPATLTPNTLNSTITRPYLGIKYA